MKEPAEIAAIKTQLIALKARRRALKAAGDHEGATAISNEMGALNQQAWRLRMERKGD